MLDVRPLHPLFAAEVIGLDLDQALGEDAVRQIREAFQRFSVLAFRGQDITDDQQVAFSRLFGDLEATRAGAADAGGFLIRLSNMGPDGGIVAPSDKQVLNNKANQQWHADSSFKAVPAKASLLSARIIPGRGGNTEYISMRAVYDALDEAMKARIDGLVTIHDFDYGRRKIDPELVSAQERAAVPPVRQAMVLDHGAHGKSLYLGAHCARVEGWDEAASRALIDELMAFATQERFVYSHAWQPHDMVLWDNRAVLHRATPFASQDEQRLMVRTTIAGEAPTVDAAP